MGVEDKGRAKMIRSRGGDRDRENGGIETQTQQETWAVDGIMGGVFVPVAVCAHVNPSLSQVRGMFWGEEELREIV